MRRLWAGWGRAAVWGVCWYAVLLAATTALAWEPDPLALALLVALGVGLVRLLIVMAGGPAIPSKGPSKGPSEGPAGPSAGPSVGRAVAWQVDGAEGFGTAGRDAQFLSYLWVVEGHLTARVPDETLRDRLRTVADRRLVQQHGFRSDDSRATALLGPDLARDLRGSPRRLTLAEIERHVTTIEAL